jgi:hypothetical protein
MVSRASHSNNAVGAWTRAALVRRPMRLVTVALAKKMAHRIGVDGAHDKRRDRGKESLTEIGPAYNVNAARFQGKYDS